MEARKMVEALPGIKEAELIKLGECAVCHRKLLEGGAPMFWVVTLERAMFDAHALRQRVGLGMMVGPLASVMGPDADLAKVFDGPHRVAVHENCADDIGHLIRLVPTPTDDTKGETP